MLKIKQKIVSITKKGQTTLPKEMRKSYGLERKALAIGTSEGILIKRIPTVEQEMGSLRKLSGRRTAKDLLTEARKEDQKREERREGMV